MLGSRGGGPSYYDLSVNCPSRTLTCFIDGTLLAIQELWDKQLAGSFRASCFGCLLCAVISSPVTSGTGTEVQSLARFSHNCQETSPRSRVVRNSSFFEPQNKIGNEKDCIANEIGQDRAVQILHLYFDRSMYFTFGVNLIS